MRVSPVILSGGAGSRLWPLSREHFPKPLLPLVSAQTLLQDTAMRMDGLSADVAAPVFVCNESHRFLLAEQVRESGREPGAIILEPEGRNTAPALALAALHLLDTDADAVMLVMPADHVIPDLVAFQAAVLQGHGLAEQGYLVTFGIVPDRAETGYGYIRTGKALGAEGACEVAQFVEKPDTAKAQTYLDSGEYLWNSGIFMMRADRWMQELDSLRPDIAAAARAAMAGATRDVDFVRVDDKAFLASASESIDYAVMEKTERAAVVPLDAGWSDVGAWSSLWGVCPQDEQGNVVQGDVLTFDTHNAFLSARHRCVAVVGLDDVVVVETADAVLVAHRDRDQDVKEIVTQLKSGQRQEHISHRCVYRPWGSYEGVDNGPRFQVKRLTVKPGASLSLQMHHHRAEHWIVVKGTARVTRGDDVFVLTEDQSTYIPLGTRHRLENPGNIPLEIIEVQSGSYLGEDDIVRFEDIYNRVVPADTGTDA